MEKYQKRAKSISAACGINTSVLNMQEKILVGDDFCAMKCRKCDYINTHTYGTYEASRWGGKYVYFCHIGLTFISSPVYDEYSSVFGGIIAGPVILGEPEFYYDDQNIVTLCNELKCISPKKAGGISDIMRLTVSEGNEEESSEMFYVSDVLYKYPIELERKLQNAISIGNKNEANKILNEMLGHIFFSSGGNLDIMKARALELAVLLSRASIDGGADVNQIINLNNIYITEVRNLKSMDELGRWLTNITKTFSRYVFDFTDVKHSDIIHKTVRYIKEKYSEKITLEEIADHVHFSKAYLSKLFKDETGTNITTLINKVRIEKSKLLLTSTNFPLAEISNMVGFDDQSYFTKNFTKTVGTTPGRYRASGGKEGKQ